MLAGRPHEPPAVGALFEDAAVGAGAAVKGVGERITDVGHIHGSGHPARSPTILAGILER